eukprot:scaffold49161_cov62-Phaeocystis_antarctica.AAC.3
MGPCTDRLTETGCDSRRAGVQLGERRRAGHSVPQCNSTQSYWIVTGRLATVYWGGGVVITRHPHVLKFEVLASPLRSRGWFGGGLPWGSRGEACQGQQDTSTQFSGPRPFKSSHLVLVNMCHSHDRQHVRVLVNTLGSRPLDGGCMSALRWYRRGVAASSATISAARGHANHDHSSARGRASAVACDACLLCRLCVRTAAQSAPARPAEEQ